MDSDEIVFSTIEGFSNKKVVLTRERFDHVAKHFPDLEKRIGDIREALEAPDRVYQTGHSSESFQYRKWTVTGKQYTVVGVQFDKIDEEIRTAFETKSSSIDYNAYVRMVYDGSPKEGGAE